MRNSEKIYEGFSLIETLFTIVILSIVMLLVATILNTVIKTSHTANAKNLARSNINYIMDTYDRALSNSEINDIHMYSSSEIRGFSFDSNGVPKIHTPGSTGSVYAESELVSGQTGNEIHVLLSGYSTWTCLGYFTSENPDDPSSPFGYIVKATSNDLEDPSRCFADNAIITVLHSYSIDTSQFSIEYIDIGDQINKMFVINAELTPLYWPMSDTFKLVKKGVSRQVVVSTKALTRY